jgi:hypothetical protein
MYALAAHRAVDQRRQNGAPVAMSAAVAAVSTRCHNSRYSGVSGETHRHGGGTMTQPAALGG